MVKNTPANAKDVRCNRCRFDPWVRTIPWRRAWQPTPGFLPGESHGQKSLAPMVNRVTKRRTWLKQLSPHTSVCLSIYPSIPSSIILALMQKWKNNPWARIWYHPVHRETSMFIVRRMASLPDLLWQPSFCFLSVHKSQLLVRLLLKSGALALGALSFQQTILCLYQQF